MPNFRALKITKHYIVNDITQRITTVEREGKKTFAELRGRETQALPRIITFFWITSPPPKKNKQTNKETKKQKPSYLLLKTSHPMQKIPESKTSNPFYRWTPPWKIVFLPATQASMVSYYGILKIAVNSCLLYSTCMCDKLATSACGFYLQREINFISKCGALNRGFKPRGPVKR